MSAAPEARLVLPPAVEHVRTARLVAAAAARRLGYDDDVVDDVRIAAGEAVTRAVLRQRAAGVEDDVTLVLRDAGAALELEVLDACGDAPEADDGIARALLGALAPDSEVAPGRLLLRWPAP